MACFENERQDNPKVLSMKLKEHTKCRPRSIWEQQARKDAMRRV